MSEEIKIKCSDKFQWLDAEGKEIMIGNKRYRVIQVMDQGNVIGARIEEINDK